MDIAERTRRRVNARRSNLSQTCRKGEKKTRARASGNKTKQRASHLKDFDLQPEDDGPHKPKDERWVAGVHVLTSNVLQPHSLALEPRQNCVDVLETLQLHSRFLCRWNLRMVEWRRVEQSVQNRMHEQNRAEQSAPHIGIGRAEKFVLRDSCVRSYTRQFLKEGSTCV